MVCWNMIHLWNDPLFLNDETSTAKQLWAKFRDTAIHGMNQYISRKISRKSNGLPWITPTIRRQIKKRNKLYRQYKTFCSDEIDHKFIVLKHSIQKQIRLSLLLPQNLTLTTLQQILKSFGPSLRVSARTAVVYSYWNWMI